MNEEQQQNRNKLQLSKSNHRRKIHNACKWKKLKNLLSVKGLDLLEQKQQVDKCICETVVLKWVQVLGACAVFYFGHKMQLDFMCYLKVPPFPHHYTCITYHNITAS
jgi:hypothetical protein